MFLCRFVRGLGVFPVDLFLARSRDEVELLTSAANRLPIPVVGEARRRDVFQANAATVDVRRVRVGPFSANLCREVRTRAVRLPVDVGDATCR